jgi:hypothetical protein
MVEVDDEAEHKLCVGERPARGAAPVGAHGPTLAINVVRSVGVGDRGAHHLVDAVELEAGRD